MLGPRTEGSVYAPMDGSSEPSRKDLRMNPLRTRFEEACKQAAQQYLTSFQYPGLIPFYML
jgi:hypothetical protein